MKQAVTAFTQSGDSMLDIYWMDGYCSLTSYISYTLAVVLVLTVVWLYCV